MESRETKASEYIDILKQKVQDLEECEFELRTISATLNLNFGIHGKINSLFKGNCSTSSMLTKVFENYITNIPSKEIKLEDINKIVYNILENKFNFGTSADYSNAIAKAIKAYIESEG